MTDRRRREETDQPLIVKWSCLDCDRSAFLVIERTKTRKRMECFCDCHSSPRDDGDWIDLDPSNSNHRSATGTSDRDTHG